MMVLVPWRREVVSEVITRSGSQSAMYYSVNDGIDGYSIAFISAVPSFIGLKLKSQVSKCSQMLQRAFLYNIGSQIDITKVLYIYI